MDGENDRERIEESDLPSDPSKASGTAMWIDQANDVVLVLLSADFAASYSLMERISNVAFGALSGA